MAIIHSTNETTPYYHQVPTTNRSWDLYLEAILGPKNRDDWLSIALAAIYILIFVTGLVGNICTCYVIVRNRRMRTVTNCYLFSLAVADILTLLLGLPPEFYSIFEAYPWKFGEWYCLLKTFMTETTSSASILTITCFTVERYMAICYSFKMQTMSGVKRAVKNITAIWILAMISALPYPLHTRVFPYIRDEYGKPIKNAIVCNIPEQWRNRMANVFQISTFLLFALPMFVITVLYIRIGVALRKAENRMGNQESQPMSSWLESSGGFCRKSLCCDDCCKSQNKINIHSTFVNKNTIRSRDGKTEELKEMDARCLFCFRNSNVCLKRKIDTRRKHNSINYFDSSFGADQYSDKQKSEEDKSKTFVNVDAGNIFNPRCKVCREVLHLNSSSHNISSSMKRQPNIRHLSTRLFSAQVANKNSNRFQDSFQPNNKLESTHDGKTSAFLDRIDALDDVCLKCSKDIDTSTFLENKVSAKTQHLANQENNFPPSALSIKYFKGDQLNDPNDMNKKRQFFFCGGKSKTKPAPLQKDYKLDDTDLKEEVKIFENMMHFQGVNGQQSITGDNVIRNRFKVKVQARPRRSVLKMLVAVVVAFFICWAPFHIQRLLTVYEQGVVDSAWIDLQNALFFVSGILYFINCTINPILYSLMSLNFKQAFSTTLRCHGNEEIMKRIECDDVSKSYFRCKISNPVASSAVLNPLSARRSIDI